MKHSVRSLRPGGFPLELCGSESILVNETFGMIFETGRVSTPGTPLTYFNDGGGVQRIFLGLTFWPKGIFLGLWKTPGFFWVAKTTQGFFWVLYFSSAQIKNNISAIYSFVFDQNQSWSWHVLAFQKLNNKICWCKNTEGFFWVC